MSFSHSGKITCTEPASPRRTHIMATVADNFGGCTTRSEFIKMLWRCGATAVRINSAHTRPEMIAGFVGDVRAAAPEMKILMDTKGPEMRTTRVATPVPLAEGTAVIIRSCADADRLSDARNIHVAARDLHKFITAGEKVMLDDGAIEIEVTAISGDGAISGRVIRGGVLDSRKTVTLGNGVIPPLPPVSERDRQFIRAAVDAGIDMIAHSFVRSAADVEAVRALTAGSGISVYAKIECREALDRLDEIILAADGILVARGDLGTAIPLYDLPMVQFGVMRECRAAGKPTIVSTQILQSMIDNPAPTRAEVNDIALAVMEGADMLLLCGETAQGRYPLQCVGMMRDVIESVENEGLHGYIYGQNG